MTEMSPEERDIRDRLRADMTTTLSRHGWAIALPGAVVDDLVDDAMHQVYAVWENRS